MGRLEGKVAVVTGAGSGIGRATARRFAEEGARVVAADRDFEAASECIETMRDAAAMEADVTRRADVVSVVDHAVEEFGGLDIYFNNAGIPARVKPLDELTRAEWDATLEVNLTALFVAAQVAAPKLVGGTLLVTASIIANRPRPGLAAYVASKAGVVGLAKALATELAPDVRVNVINPGPANTPMLDGFGFDTDPAQALPLKRLIEPEDIEKLLVKHDRIDVYFNNAGIPETVKPLAEITRDEWDTVLDVNLTSLFIAAQVVARSSRAAC